MIVGSIDENCENLDPQGRQIIIDLLNNDLVAVYYRDEGGCDELFAARSSDGGETWSITQVTSTGIYDVSNVAIAQATDGTIYVSFCYQTGVAEVSYSGGVWSAAQVLFTDVSTVAHQSLCIASDDNRYIVYYSASATPLRVRCSSDSWTSYVASAATNFSPVFDIAMEDTSTFWICGRCISPDRVGVFSGDMTTGVSFGYYLADYTLNGVLLGDGAGNMHAVYTDYNGALDIRVHRLAGSSGPDDGVIHSGTYITSASQPTISRSADGKYHCVWDYGNDVIMYNLWDDGWGTASTLVSGIGASNLLCTMLGDGPNDDSIPQTGYGMLVLSSLEFCSEMTFQEPPPPAEYELQIDWLRGVPAASIPAGSNLVGWWRFQEGAGTTVSDETGDHDGTLTGTGLVWLFGGTRPDFKLICSGDTGQIDVGSDSALRPDNITVLMAGYVGGKDLINPIWGANYKIDSGFWKGWQIQQASNSNQLSVVARIGGATYSAYIGTAYDNIWYLFGFKVDGSKLYTIFLPLSADADFVASTDHGAAPGTIDYHSTAPPPTTFLGNDEYGTHAAGGIEEAFIFNTAISDDEIEVIWECLRPSPDCKGWGFSRGRKYNLPSAEVGKLDTSLVDIGGRYLPSNTDSPFYSYLVPGRPIRLLAEADGTTYWLFNGFLDDILPRRGVRGDFGAELPASDGMDVLTQKDSPVTLYSDKRADFIIGEVLAAANWHGAKRTLDTGPDIYPVVYVLAGQNTKALSFINDVMLSEGGLCYTNNKGYFAYETRYHRSTGTHIASQWTLTEEDHLVGFEPLGSIGTVLNRVLLEAIPKEQAASQTVIYSLEDNATNGLSPQIPPGETITIWGNFTDANGLPNIADSFASISGDYSGNSEADGTGSDLTTDLDITRTTFADAVKHEVENTGSSTVYLTKLETRGKIYTDRSPVKAEATSGTSRARYQDRDAKIDVPFYQTFEQLERLAEWQLKIHDTGIQSYKVRLRASNLQHVKKILALQISDRITLQSTTYNLDEDFFIEHIDMSYEIGGVLECTWIVSSASTSAVWVLGESQLGVDAIVAS